MFTVELTNGQKVHMTGYEVEKNRQEIRFFIISEIRRPVEEDWDVKPTSLGARATSVSGFSRNRAVEA